MMLIELKRIFCFQSLGKENGKFDNGKKMENSII